MSRKSEKQPKPEWGKVRLLDDGRIMIAFMSGIAILGEVAFDLPIVNVRALEILGVVLSGYACAGRPR